MAFILTPPQETEAPKQRFILTPPAEQAGSQEYGPGSDPIATPQDYELAYGNDPISNDEESGYLRRGLVDPAISLLGKGVVGAGETAVGLADIVTGGHVGKALEDYAGYDPALTNKVFESFQSPEYRANKLKFRRAKGVLGKAEAAIRNPSLVINTALESVPSMVGGWGITKKLVAAGVPAYIAGGVGEAVVTAAQNTEQTRQESPDRLLSAKQIAINLGSGGVTGLIGILGGKVAAKLKIADVDSLFAGGKVSDDVKKSVIRKITEGFLQEGFLEELPQSVQEQMAQNLAQDKPLTDGLNESAVMGALSGGLMGGTVNLYNHYFKPEPPTKDNIQPGPAAPGGNVNAPRRKANTQINTNILNSPDLQTIIPDEDQDGNEPDGPTPPIDTYLDILNGNEPTDINADTILSRPPRDTGEAIQGQEAIEKAAEATNQADLQAAAENQQSPKLTPKAIDVIAKAKRAIKRRKGIEMSKPKEERDWTAINDIESMIKEASVTGNPEILAALHSEFSGKSVKPDEVKAAEFNLKAKKEAEERAAAVELVTDDQGLIRAKSGYFKNEKSATLFKRARKIDGEVVPVPGGYAIMPKALADAKDQEARKQTGQEENQPIPAADVKLPKELSGIKPRYGYKSNNFTLSFDNDLDRAAYTLAQKKKNKAHDRILATLQDQTGMTEQELVDHGAKVREQIKQIAKERTESGKIQVPRVAVGKVAIVERGNNKPKEEMQTIPVVKSEQLAWYINADDRPVLTIPSDAVGYRGPYSKEEVAELTGTDSRYLDKAEHGKPVYTPDFLPQKEAAPAETKKQKALREYTEYVNSLSDDQKRHAGDLIVENPESPSGQKLKLINAMKGYVESTEKPPKPVVDQKTEDVSRNGEARQPWEIDSDILAKRIKADRVTIDNPGGQWLKDQIDMSKEGHGGSRTATVTNVKIPVNELLKLKGMMGEHNRIEVYKNGVMNPKIRELVMSIKKDGLKNPPFINVEHDGTTRVNEGNHRIRAAKEAGLKEIPVEIAYFAGGERADGPLSLKRLLDMGKSKSLDEFIGKTEADPQPGDTIRFTPKDPMYSPVEGVVRESINNGDGFHVIVGDQGRVDRIWKNKGDIEILKSVAGEELQARPAAAKAKPVQPEPIDMTFDEFKAAVKIEKNAVAIPTQDVFAQKIDEIKGKKPKDKKTSNIKVSIGDRVLFHDDIEDKDIPGLLEDIHKSPTSYYKTGMSDEETYARIDAARRRGQGQQPDLMPKVEPAKAKNPDFIGRNQNNEALFQDKKGVRYKIDNGVKISEPVAMRPTRQGINLEVDRSDRPEWQTVDELKAQGGAKPAYSVAWLPQEEIKRWNLSDIKQVDKYGQKELEAVLRGDFRSQLKKLAQKKLDWSGRPEWERPKTKEEMAAAPTKKTIPDGWESVPGSGGSIVSDDGVYLISGNEGSYTLSNEISGKVGGSYTDIDTAIKTAYQDRIDNNKPGQKPAPKSAIDSDIDELLAFSDKTAKAAEIRERKAAADAKIKSGLDKIKAGAAAFNELFGEKGTVGYQGEIDPEKWAKVKEALDLMWEGFKESSDGVMEAAKAFIEHSITALSSKGKPYVDKYIREDIKEALAKERESGKIETNQPQSEGVKDEKGLLPENGRGNESVSPSGNTQGGIPAPGVRPDIGTGGKGDNSDFDANVLASEQASGERLPRPEIPAGSKPVEGQQAAGSGGKGLPGDRTDELVSDAVGGTNVTDRAPLDDVNYELEELAPVALTKGQRKEINAQAKSLLERGGPFSPDEKNILRQYTGEGGLASGKKESLNQHYTDYPTIQAIYRAIKASAFKFKKALEPSVGSGNFVGMAPDANWTTVDIDPTNHAIVKALYPKARHYLTSFENIKKSGFDLVISNVPFLEQRGADAIHNRPDIKALHDFYFVHALDRVRDNGLVVFITSRGTMDKKSDAVRREITGKADILAAFRLPSGHFEKNADTSVITDVIVMQKRPQGAAPSDTQQAINDQFVTASETNDGIVLNDYYHDRMDHMLGAVEVGKDKARFGKITYNITGPAALERMMFSYQPYDISDTAAETPKIDQETSEVPRDSEEFYKWASENNIPYKLSRITTTHTDQDGNTHQTDTPATEGFDRGIVIENDSRVLVIDQTVDFSDVQGQARIYKSPDMETARKILTLQRIADHISDYQLNDDTNAQERAISFIEDYQQRYKKHPEKDRTLKKFMTNAGEKAYFAELSTLFKPDFGMPDSLKTKTRYTGSGVAEVTGDSPLMVRAFSLEDNKGRIELKGQTLISTDEISKLLNRGYAIAGNGNTLQNDILYYAGNVYQKIAEAEQFQSKTRNSAFKAALARQIDKLNAIKPEPKQIDDIHFKGHEKWIIKILQNAGLGIQRVMTDEGKSEIHYPGSKIYEKYLNSRQLVSRGKNESITSFMMRIREAEDQVAEENARIKKAIKDQPALLKQVETAYNSKYRNYVEPDYGNAAYLIADVLAEIEKNSDIRLRKNQIKWVLQAVYEGKGINAHDVGGGKTFAAITLARALKKRGVAKKPIFVVPAKTIKKWERDIKTLFPDATVVNLGKLAAGKRTKQLFELSHTNADYVLISHEGFAHLKLPLEKEIQYIDAILAEHVDDPGASGRQSARIDDDIAQLRRVISETPRDSRLTFDKLGIDMIVADEAHNFKNIAVRGELVRFGLGTAFGIKAQGGAAYVVRGSGDKWAVYHPKTGEMMGNKTYKTENEALLARENLPAIPGTATLKSARSYDFRFKANYITDTNNGNNVFMLTATPTPNKPMEIYTMIRHLSPTIFHEYGIYNDRDFSDQFFSLGTVENRIKRKPANVLRAIINGQDLRGILNRFVDKVRMEEMPWIKVPDEKMNRHYLDQSAEYALIAEDLKRRQENVPTRPVEGDDRLLTIYTSGRAASIDPRLYGGNHAEVSIDERSFDANDDKVQFTIDGVVKQFRSDNDSGQLIFLDAAGHQQAARGALAEDIHTEMKRELVEKGMDPKQIAIINGKVITNPATGRESASGDKDKRKQDIADAYNEGKIKVIIGSTTSMGEGMDLQVTTSDIWHVDIPFKPGDIRQRNGRGVRFGNLYKSGTVNVHYLMMRGSFDAMSFDLVLKKKGWNEALWDREVADVISTEEEMTAGAMPQRQQILIELETDPTRKAELMIGFRADQLNEERRQAASTDFYARSRVLSATRVLDEDKAGLARRENMLKTMTPDMEIEDEKKRKSTFNKMKGQLKQSIAYAKKRIPKNEEKIAILEEKQKKTQASLDAINAKVADFDSRFYDPEGKIAVPQDFDVANPRFFADDPVNMATSDENIRFQTKQTVTNFSGVSLKDLRKLKFMRKKSVTINKDGHVEIQLAPGKTLVVKGLTDIGKGKVRVNLGIDALGSVKTAKYQDRTVEFTHLSDIGTIYHEITGHAFEEMGILNAMDRAVINTRIARETGKAVGKGVTGKEARADWISDNLMNRDKYRGTVVGRVLQKIADFIDALVNLHHMTARGVLRGIEKGSVLNEAPQWAGSAVNEFAQSRLMPVSKATRNILDNPNFRRWFGKSKVVDEAGNPLVVYHGTTAKDIKSFLPKGGKDTDDRALNLFRNAIKNNKPFGYMNFRSGSFFSPDPEYARNYTAEDKGAIYPVYIKAENPLYYDMKTKVTKGANGKTPDALILTEGGNINEIAVIDPTQIKSVYNTGEFNPENPDILHQQSAARWFSQMEKTVAAKFPNTGTPEQFTKLLDTMAKKGEFKAAELEWSGVKDWLESQKGKVTKDEMLDWLAANNVRVQEVVKGGDDKINKLRERVQEIDDENDRLAEPDDDLLNERDALIGEIEELGGTYRVTQEGTKFSEYQEPGGEDYKELLLTLPSRLPLPKNFYWKENKLYGPDKGETQYVAEAKDKRFLINEAPYGGYMGFVVNLQNRQKNQIGAWNNLREAKASIEQTAASLEKGPVDDFKSSHFDEPNILAHVRFNTRTGPNGEKMLFLEEIQSDWAQKGRKEGFGKQGKYVVFSNEAAVGEFKTRQEAEDALENAGGNGEIQDLSRTPTPNMPYKQTSQWAGLALRRMVRYAAENGYDSIAWTNGETQADRYDLSKHLSQVNVEKAKRASYLYKIEFYTHANPNKMETTYANSDSELESIIGKELTQKVIDAKLQPLQGKNFSGLDLKVGGEGMKAFYDKMLPNIANKLFNKATWGKAKAGKIEVDVESEIFSDTPQKDKVYLEWIEFDENNNDIHTVRAENGNKLYTGELNDAIDWARNEGYQVFNNKAEMESWEPVPDKIPITAHVLPITAAMKSKALAEGMPLFQEKSLTDILKQDIPKDDPNLARFKRKAKKQMTLGQKVITPAQWNAKRYPKFDKIFKRQRKREKEAITTLSKALEQTNNVWDLSSNQEAELSTVISSIENKKITSIPDWFLAEKDRLALNPEHYTQLETWLLNKNVSGPVAKAYAEMRESLDNDLLMVWNKLNSDPDVDPETIKSFRKQLNQVHNYFPHMRYGNHYIQFFDDEDIDPDTGKPRLVYREHFTSLNKMAAAIGKRQYKRLIKEAPELERYRMDWGKVNKLSEDVYSSPLQMDAIQQVLNAAVSKITDPKTKEMFKTLLPSATADELKTRGWAAHAIHRKNIPGHEMQDIKKVLFDYKSGLYGWLTKMDASRDFTTLLKDIDAKNDKTLYEYSRGYVYDMLANSDGVDRGVQMAKSIFFTKYLGFNLKTAALNLTQNIITGAPRLGMEVKGGYFKWMSNAGRTLTRMDLTEDQHRFVKEMHENGTSEANFIADVSGRISAGPKKLGGKLVGLMGLPMAVAEKFNRVTLGLAAFNAARNGDIVNAKTLKSLGLKPGEKASYDVAKEFAEGIVDDAHFVYGKSNRPEMFRGSTTAKLGSTAYVFRSFSHHLINLWKMMWREGGPGKRALMKSIAATVAVGGLASIPLYKTLMNVVRQATGDDDWGDKLLDKIPADANWLRDIAMYGIPSMAGINLGGSVGMELPVFERYNINKSITGQLWSGFGELIGIPGAMAEDVEHSINTINRGRPVRALEYILPSVAANVLKGYRMGSEGVTTATGRPIVLPGEKDITVLDKVDMFKKMIGFQPIASQKGWDLSKKIRNFQAYKLNAQSDFADRMIKAIRDKDNGEIKKVQKEIMEWNIKQMKEGHPEYVINLRQSIRSRLTGRQPPAYMRGRAMEMKKKAFGE